MYIDLATYPMAVGNCNVYEHLLFVPYYCIDLIIDQCCLYYCNIIKVQTAQLSLLL